MKAGRALPVFGLCDGVCGALATCKAKFLKKDLLVEEMLILSLMLIFMLSLLLE